MFGNLFKPKLARPFIATKEFVYGVSARGNRIYRSKNDSIPMVACLAQHADEPVDITDYSLPLPDATWRRVRASEVPQEVKERLVLTKRTRSDIPDYYWTYGRKLNKNPGEPIDLKAEAAKLFG